MSRSVLEYKSGVFTIQDVADLIGRSAPTIRKWCNDDKLDSYLIPGSRERRITVVALIRFMRTRNMPVPVELINIEARFLNTFVKNVIDGERNQEAG